MSPRTALHGILLIDKPAGITSAEAVRRIKRSLGRAARVGHLGTLDPFATGLLPILIGEATKLAPFLQAGEREYCGAILLGAETDTLDPTGTVISRAPVPSLEVERLRELTARFTGLIEQVPPLYSALKRDGVRLYELARRGEEVAPPAARRVEIKLLKLEIADADTIRFRVRCSTGTYIRSLARDLGRALGSAAHLSELRRTHHGYFEVAAAVALDERLCAALERGAEPLIGLREALVELPEVKVTTAEAERIRHGDPGPLADRIPAAGGLFKVVSDGRLVAVARATSRATAALVRGFAA